MSPIRILALSCLFPNPEQPNYGVFVLNRLRAVRGRCAIRVIAPIPVYPLLNRWLRGRNRGTRGADQESWEGLEVSHPRFLVLPRVLKGLDALSYWFVTVRTVRKMEREGGFAADIIDVHWTYPDLVAGYWLARTRRKPLIVTVRGKEALYPGESGLRKWLLTRCIRRADAVITLSDELKVLVIALGVRPDRVRTILNGVDGATFMRRDMQACRERLRLPASKKIIVSVGALVRAKGHDKLVEAVQALGRDAEVELYIIGGTAGAGRENDVTGRLRALMAAAGSVNIHLVGRVDHAALAEWYGAADMFCLASEGEGCPNVVLEALSCGAPVVITEVGAVRELIKDGCNGFVVPRLDVKELSAAIGRALDSSWDRERIAESMESWSWGRCADEVVGTYDAVLGITENERGRDLAEPRAVDQERAHVGR